MTGVHRLQKVEDLRSAHFADDDAFRTHTKAVLDEIAHSDFALAFDIRRTGFEAHHMRLLQLKFGGVFAGDDALMRVDIARQAVQKRRLARARTAGQRCCSGRGR